MAEAFQFDPRDLISEPFIACPRCSHNTFGIIDISENSYMRRCRDCWHKADFWLPKLHKKIIYLDQNVISNLMKLVTPAAKGHEKVKADTFWQELYDLLVQLRNLQLIVCPYSDSHENESLTFELNDALKKMYQSLGSGNSFVPFDQIRTRQIIELGRAWSEDREPQFSFKATNALERDPNEWNNRIYITVGPNPFVKADELRRSRKEVHAYVERLFRDVWSKERHDFQYWYDLERMAYQSMLGREALESRRERLRVSTEYNPTEPPSLRNLNAILPSFAENIVHILRRVMRFPPGTNERTAEEVAALEKSFGEANRIAEAPFVKLSALMYASIAMKAASGQQKPPNAGTATDIDTVSYLLPFCDAMFIDNGCRSLLEDVPKAFRPPDTGKLFSANVRDKFLAYLRSVRYTISKEQLDAVKRVYGSEYTEGVVGTEEATGP